MGPLTFDQSGNLWGTTYYTGYSSPNHTGYGVVFEFVNSGGTLASTPTIIHTFSSGADGQNPNAALVMDSSGNLYGTTIGQNSGGYCNAGTVFKISGSGSTATYQVLYSFPGKQSNGMGGYTGISGDGYYLYGGVAVDSSGNVYGVNYNGGSGNGTLFQLSNSTGINACGSGNNWTETIVHTFAGGSSDGADPDNTLILSGSTLYGTTFYGGQNSVGVAYSIPK